MICIIMNLIKVSSPEQNSQFYPSSHILLQCPLVFLNKIHFYLEFLSAVAKRAIDEYGEEFMGTLIDC